MGDFYHRMLTRNGFGAEVEAMRRVGAAHRPAPFQTNPEIMAEISDRMLDETVIWGDLEKVAAGLDECRAAGADLPVIHMPRARGAEMERILGTLVS
jgi:hypothetical protein